MHGHGKSDGCVVPAKPPNNAASAAAEVVEGRRPAKGNTDRPTHVPDAVPGSACQAGWIVCARQHERIRRHGSRRCCITLTLAGSWRRIGRSTRRPRRELIR